MIDPNITSTIVILLRTLIPFTILRWPLAGGIVALLADMTDIMIFGGFGYGFLSDVPYHKLDKIFDMWYLFFEFLIVRQWIDILARRTGTVLFAWRFVGFLIFEITGLRVALVLAPNIFEYFFLTILIIKKFNKKFILNVKSLVIVLLIVGIPNLIKEYLAHVKYPGQIAPFFRDKLLWWIYD